MAWPYSYLGRATDSTSLNLASNTSSQTFSNLDFSMNLKFVTSTANSVRSSDSYDINLQNTKMGNQSQPETSIFNESHNYTIGLNPHAPCKMELADVVISGEGNKSQIWKVNVTLVPVIPVSSDSDSALGSSEVSDANTAKVVASQSHTSCSNEDHVFAKPRPVLPMDTNHMQRLDASTSRAMELIVDLSNWSIQYEFGNYVLRGNNLKNHNRPWRSRPLHTYTRHDSRYLISLNGGRNVQLFGEIKHFCKSGSVELIQDDIMRHFQNGFPTDWKVKLDNVPVKERSSRADSFLSGHSSMTCIDPAVPVEEWSSRADSILSGHSSMTCIDPAVPVEEWSSRADSILSGHSSMTCIDPAVGQDNYGEVRENNPAIVKSTTPSLPSPRMYTTLQPEVLQTRLTIPRIEMTAVEDIHAQHSSNNNMVMADNEDSISNISEVSSLHSSAKSTHSEYGSVFSYASFNCEQEMPGPTTITNWIPIIKKEKRIWELYIKGDFTPAGETVEIKDSEVGPITYRTYEEGFLCVGQKKFSLKGSLEDRGQFIPPEIRKHFINKVPLHWSGLVNRWGTLVNNVDRVQRDEPAEHSSDVGLSPELRSSGRRVSKQVPKKCETVGKSVRFLIDIKPVRHLVDWMPQLVRDRGEWGIILTGKLISVAPKSESSHRSSVIIYCVSLKKVETLDMIYILQGPMAKQTQKQAADPRTRIPGNLLKFFHRGIPSTLEKIIPIWVKTCNLRLHNEEQCDTTIEHDKCATPKRTVNRTKCQKNSPQDILNTSSRGRKLRQTQPYWLLPGALVERETPKIASSTQSNAQKKPPRSKPNPSKDTIGTKSAESNDVRRKPSKAKSSSTKNSTEPESAQSNDVKRKRPRSTSDPAKNSTEPESAESNDVKRKRPRSTSDPAKNSTEPESAESNDVKRKRPRSTSDPAKNSTEPESAESNDVKRKRPRSTSDPAKNSTEPESAESNDVKRKPSKAKSSSAKNSTEPESAQSNDVKRKRPRSTSDPAKNSTEPESAESNDVKRKPSKAKSSSAKNSTEPESAQSNDVKRKPSKAKSSSAKNSTEPESAQSNDVRRKPSKAKSSSAKNATEPESAQSNDVKRKRPKAKSSSAKNATEPESAQSNDVKRKRPRSTSGNPAMNTTEPESAESNDVKRKPSKAKSSSAKNSTEPESAESNDVKRKPSKAKFSSAKNSTEPESAQSNDVKRKPSKAKSSSAKNATEPESAQSNDVKRKPSKAKSSSAKNSTEPESAQSNDVKRKPSKAKSSSAKNSTEPESAQSNDVKRKPSKAKSSSAKNATEPESAQSNDVKRKPSKAKSSSAKNATEPESAQSNDVKRKPSKAKSSSAKNAAQSGVEWKQPRARSNPSKNATEKKLLQPISIPGTCGTDRDMHHAKGRKAGEKNKLGQPTVKNTKGREAVTLKSIIALKEKIGEEERKELRSKAFVTLSNLPKKKLTLKQQKQREDALMEFRCLASPPDPFEDPDNRDILGEPVDDGHVIVGIGQSSLTPTKPPYDSGQCTPIVNYVGCLVPSLPSTPETSRSSELPFSFRPRDEILQYARERVKEMQELQMSPEKLSSAKYLKTNVKTLRQQLSEAVAEQSDKSDSDFSFNYESE